MYLKILVICSIGSDRSGQKEMWAGPFQTDNEKDAFKALWGNKRPNKMKFLSRRELEPGKVAQVPSNFKLGKVFFKDLKEWCKLC